MELSKALRTAYYGLLSTLGMPVYDSFAPDDASYPYIILSSQTSVEVPNKGDKFYDATILIDIVTGSYEPIGRAASEDIAYDIDFLIRGGEDITVEGYQLADSLRMSDTDLTSKNGPYYIYRKLMRYEHSTTKI